jgi:hypothetical protein
MEVLTGLVGSILAVLIGMAINIALRLRRLKGRVDEGFKRMDNGFKEINDRLNHLSQELGELQKAKEE